MDGRPIGVFDSGVGGLTVVHELHRQLPHESMIYFGDTARVPYGNKSPDTVRRYAHEILAFLLTRDVKLVVVACNTASAHALESLQRSAAVPVEGVVGPGARAAVKASRSHRIGVIGTAGVVKSGAYERAIRALLPDAQVRSVACPLFVPLVEEGWFDHEATRLVAREYLAPLRAEAIDTLVLGCTHYPLLKTLLAEELGSGIALIDSAEETATAVGRELWQAGLQAPADADSRLHFVVSDAPEQFASVGARFLGDRVKDIETVTFG
jgi:glutamate racemase